MLVHLHIKNIIRKLRGGVKDDDDYLLKKKKTSKGFGKTVLRRRHGR